MSGVPLGPPGCVVISERAPRICGSACGLPSLLSASLSGGKVAREKLLLSVNTAFGERRECKRTECCYIM